ncbi:uncharacterized protein HMPREF1541_07269 [Cyphellophora europaea CBS 101466]|uniref:Uncharacterized protein n=1 Tax=Cyphellophora europaea (strain CBS 101466) TaxID=1220924 RepID=W2RM99_CYPE1|nr:uncharacterized protein HMPREF1541_07269 [Cyphellophora europaea CBS 101466]ETN37646.1 hypothetical protein HMPREF1541_07269 [Cyphellophora europaea CBS 101466]
MSLVESSKVHTGFWINRSRDPILGATLTLKSEYGAVIVALSAILVGVASTCVFEIICFVWHQLRARKPNTTMVWRQQQVTLRNTIPPVAVIWDLLSTGWKSRASSYTSWTKNLFSATLVAFYLAATFAASLYSSAILDSSNVEVSISSSSCGMWKSIYEVASNIEIDDFVVASGTALSNVISESINYQRACYHDTSGAASACNTFTVPSVAPNVDKNAACPFSASICFANQESVKIDSGRLNSNHFLGINSLSSLDLRKVTECSPLTQSGHERWTSTEEVQQSWPNAIPLDGDSYVMLDYGNQTSFPWTWLGNKARMNSTPSYTMDQSNTVSWMYSFPGFDDNSTFVPIPELQRHDADLTLLFLSSNKIYFKSVSDDPFFAAHQPFVMPGLYGNETMYHADNAANVLGCTEQYQFCTLRSCTSLAGILSAPGSIAELNLSAIQLAIFHILYQSIYNQVSSVAAIANAQTPNLLAQQRMFSGQMQLPLPSDQWKLEVLDWHATVMAMLQYSIANFATGPTHSDWEQYIEPPTGALKDLCGNVRVRANGSHANVSVFGLSFVIAFCGLAVLLDVMLLRSGAWVGRWTPGISGTWQAWEDDDLFELLARADGARDKLDEEKQQGEETPARAEFRWEPVIR